MEIGTAVRRLNGLRVVGWRAWTVVETPHGLRLGSVIYDEVWRPGAAALAACRRDEDPFAEAVAPHRVPGTECSCGFHAAHDPVDALSYLRGRDEPGTLARVLGEVALSAYGVPVLSPGCALVSSLTCTATPSASARRWQTSSAAASI